MAPKSTKKKGMTSAPAGPRPDLEPALGRSMVLNLEGLDKVLPALAAVTNEWKTTSA
jgi:hypothetical protein